MIRIVHILLMLFLCGAGFAQDDSIVVEKEKKPSFFRKIGKGISMFIKEFDTVDTNYIEPQHYKFQAMLQSTSNLEDFEIKHKDGASVTFSPKTTTKIEYLMPAIPSSSSAIRCSSTTCILPIMQRLSTSVFTQPSLVWISTTVRFLIFS